MSDKNWKAIEQADSILRNHLGWHDNVTDAEVVILDRQIHVYFPNGDRVVFGVVAQYTDNVSETPKPYGSA